MDKLRCIEVFVTAVDQGSFTAAARQLDITAVMVGKQVRQLEIHLGARLLQRTTRHQSLTDAGRRFYAEGRKLLEQLRWAEASVEQLRAAPSGELRITAQHTLGQQVLAGLAAGYQALHPQVQITLDLSNQVVDLAQDGFDVAVRVGQLPADINLVARPLGFYRMVVCGAPGYLAQRGRPQTPADLAGHDCLGFTVWNQAVAWRLHSPDGGQMVWPMHRGMQSNDGQALRQAALHGAGLLLQPRVMVAEDLATGRLEEVLQAHLPTPRPVHVLHSLDRQPLPKVSSFVQYLQAHMPPLLA